MAARLEHDRTPDVISSPLQPVSLLGGRGAEGAGSPRDDEAKRLAAHVGVDGPNFLGHLMHTLPHVSLSGLISSIEER